MSYAFELHFDETTEALIRRGWESAARMGLETRRNGVAPHVTLAIASAYDASLAPRLRQFAAEHPPFAVEFGGMESFPTGVLFLAPVESDELMSAHRDFHARFTSLPAAANSHYYEPARWVPHCTLGMGVFRDVVQTDVSFDDLAVRGSFTRLRVVEYPALVMHFDCPLGDASEVS